jgi:hypothetical protein
VGLSRELTKERWKRRNLERSKRKSSERFNHHNAKKAKERNRGPRIDVTKPAGHKIFTDIFLEPLAHFLAGKHEIKPPPPPYRSRRYS